tara:strand:- start:107 stop:298 length:192 start_codon:yes stop_codon:yes gene_type:complete
MKDIIPNITIILIPIFNSLLFAQNFLILVDENKIIIGINGNKYLTSSIFLDEAYSEGNTIINE